MPGTLQIVAVLITAAVLLVSAATTSERSILADRDGEIRTAVEPELYSDADASLSSVEGPPQAVATPSTPDESNSIRRINFNDIDLTEEEISLVEQVEGIPDAVTELDGKFVTIEGFMYPAPQDTGLPAFVLVEQLFY